MTDFPVRIAEHFPILLQSFRKHAGLTQAAAALRLGVTQQTLSALERNADKVSADRLLRVLHLYGVELVLRKANKDAPPSKNTSEPIW